MAFFIQKRTVVSVLLSTVVGAAYADENSSPAYHIQGSIPFVIQTEETANGQMDASGVQGKTIQLMRWTPSLAQKEKTALALQTYQGERDYSTGIIPFKSSPTAVDLGMNNVPVLDQGAYGTCVTFATTAAIDAALGIGDYVDQQCSLELDMALGKNYWDGAYFATDVLLPLKKYGVVQKNRCNAYYPNRYMWISTTEYKARASKTVKMDQIKYISHYPISVDDVRADINAGRRVAIGFGMMADDSDPVSVQGFNINIGGRMKAGGLWACQQPSSWTSYCGEAYAGHEVLITGYDDSQELFKIRNSWSTSMGDSGEFYMTYAFFSAMAGDGTAIYK